MSGAYGVLTHFNCSFRLCKSFDTLKKKHLKKMGPNEILKNTGSFFTLHISRCGEYIQIEMRRR